MKYYPYFIQVLTNMHVGSGDANYGIVDKLVQRDPVTGFPTINASSLKGALREHFEGIEPALVDTIFGKESKSKDQPSEPGLATFLEADLVGIPVRSNFQRFVMALNKAQLEMLNKKAKRLTGDEIFNNDFSSSNTLYYQQGQPGYDVYLDDIKITNKENFENPIQGDAFPELFHHRIASLTDEDFSANTQNLPVIARNHLENGISQNLWYEEVVPHQTVFLTFIGFDKDDLKNEFEKIIIQSPIQIGGNASIGYGLTKFYPVELQGNINHQNQEQ